MEDYKMKKLKEHIANITKADKIILIRMRGWWCPEAGIHPITCTVNGKDKVMMYDYDDMQQALYKFGNMDVWKVSEYDDQICFVLYRAEFDYVDRYDEPNFIKEEFKETT